MIYNVLYFINGCKEAIKHNEETKSNSEGCNRKTCWHIIGAVSGGGIGMGMISSICF